MQHMPALSADGTSSHITQNQATYIKKRVQRLAILLQTHVKTVLPNLSVGYRIHLTPMTFSMDISLGTERLPRQYLATLEGFLDLKWAHENGHGKDLQIGLAITTGQERGQYERIPLMPANYRYDLRALSQQIIAHLTTLDALPRLKDKDTLEAWQLLKSNGHQPWRSKKIASEFFESQTRKHIATPSDKMTPLIDRATRTWQKNFRNRYEHRNNLFEGLSFHYNPLRQQLEVHLKIQPQHAATHQQKILIQGPVTVGNKGTKKIFYFTPQCGIDFITPPERLEIGTGFSSEILKDLIIDSGLLIAPQRPSHNHDTPSVMANKTANKTVDKTKPTKAFQIANDNTAQHNHAEKPEEKLDKRTRNRLTRRKDKQVLQTLKNQ